MRTLFAAAFVGLAAAAAAADDPVPKADPPAAKKKAEPTLKAGDAAPVLKADKWLQGAGVTAFEPGKVYVVEFWATWCGPCVAMMPHLADLQDEYRAKGVTVVGFSSVAQDKRDKAEAFVAQRGPKLGYTFGWGDSDETHAAWMTAAGQNGIPCSFVVGRDGKIAYIGHPLFLDPVLPKVLAGTWDAATGTAEMQAADKEWDAVYEVLVKTDADPAAGLARWAAFAAKHPTLANDPYMTGARLNLLVKTKRFDKAKTLAEEMLVKAGKREDMFLLDRIGEATAGNADLARVRVNCFRAALDWADDARRLPTQLNLADALLAAGEAAEGRALAAAAVPLAARRIAGDKDFSSTLLLAKAQFLAGDRAKAKASAERALGYIADDPSADRRKYVAEQAKKYGAESKAADKDK